MLVRETGNEQQSENNGYVFLTSEFTLVLRERQKWASLVKNIIVKMVNGKSFRDGIESRRRREPRKLATDKAVRSTLSRYFEFSSAFIRFV